ncbi:hypothetical protein D3C75_396390 [compost metagenome]
MSQLILDTGYSSVPPSVVATFDGPAVDTLGEAINFFTEESVARAKRLTSGEVAAVPEVIVEGCKKFLENPINRYTINQTSEGFDIWISDGPERYSLVDD